MDSNGENLATSNGTCCIYTRWNQVISDDYHKMVTTLHEHSSWGKQLQANEGESDFGEPGTTTCSVRYRARTLLVASTQLMSTFLSQRHIYGYCCRLSYSTKPMFEECIVPSAPTIKGTRTEAHVTGTVASSGRAHRRIDEMLQLRPFIAVKVHGLVSVTLVTYISG